MAGKYEHELQNYLDVIDGKHEATPEVSDWMQVRLRIDGRPKFLATLTSLQHKLFCIVELRDYMGEGCIRIPIGLYDDHPHLADNAIVSRNRRALSFIDGQGMPQVIRKLGLRWEWPVEDITCTGGGGYKMLYTPGYELILTRSFSHVNPNLRVLLPENDGYLHALSADGLTGHINDVLSHIHIQPLGPEELQLQAPS